MGRRGRLATTVGLVLLVLIDVALVVAALRISARSRTTDAVAVGTGSPSGDQTGPGPTPTASAASSPTGSPTATSVTTGSAARVAAVPLQVLLSAVDGSVAWRAGKAGSCGAGGATLSVTTDGGASWKNRTAPFPVLSRLQPTDATRAFAVGATSGCDPGIKTTSDGGGTWPGTGVLADTLARDPKDGTKVRAPGNRTVAPCDGKLVVDLARSSASAAQALCADGSVRTTTDDGASWLKFSDQPDALALDSRVTGGDVTTYLAVRKQGCPGVAVVSLTGGATTDVACVGTTAPVPGTVAISVPTPDAGWLLVGDTMWRSGSGLKSWTRAGG